MARWCWVNFQCRGVLLIWIIVGQGPTALAVGAGGVVWTFFSLVYQFSSFSLAALEVVICGKYKNLNKITKIKHISLKFNSHAIFVIIYSLHCKIEEHAV